VKVCRRDTTKHNFNSWFVDKYACYAADRRTGFQDVLAKLSLFLAVDRPTVKDSSCPYSFRPQIFADNSMVQSAVSGVNGHNPEISSLLWYTKFYYFVRHSSTADTIQTEQDEFSIIPPNSSSSRNISTLTLFMSAH